METIRMTSEEAILHIKKIANAFDEEYEDMNIIEQIRHGGDLAENCMREIMKILEETTFDA